MTRRVAVVGTGFGCRVHVPALRAAGFDVIALVGRDRERTERRAERIDIPSACAGLPEALALDVDAVTIDGGGTGEAATFADGVANQRVLDQIRKDH